MKKGKIVQISGPVIDVEFEDSDLPYIKDALEVDNDGKRCVMEVAQHIGNNTVRCIMLASSEGLHKDMEVVATGSGIKVPVGEKTLGRLFNVLGDTIDKGESLKDEQHWCIHRDAPGFEEQSPAVEVLETGIKVIDLLAPYAKGGKIGLFEAANGGTLFLDEVSEMDYSLQAKLLRAIQEGRIRPVGGVQEIEVDVRLISASNADLNTYIQQGRFRRDLYYRLSTFQIHIPPLRDRRQDIPALTDVVLSELSKKLKRSITITQEARRCLALHDWPGNVRELRNVLEFSAYLSDNGAIVRDSLPEHIVRPAVEQPEISLAQRVRVFERAEISKLLLKNGADLAGKKETARQLGISLATLYNKLADPEF